MNFANPTLALAALCAAGIPLVLHLVLRRPRITPWPSTMLLRRAIEKVRRRRRLERWILLALRAFGIALLGIAMAGPLSLSWRGDRASRELFVVIDDGATSAERFSGGSTGMDRLKQQSIQAINLLQAGDTVAIISAAQPAHMVMQPTTDIERARRVVEQLQTQPVPADINAAIEITLPPNEPSNTARREVLLASSFRRGSLDMDHPLPAAWIERARNVQWTSLRPPEQSSENRSVQSVRVGRSTTELQGNKDLPLRVELRRTSQSNAAVDSINVRSPSGDSLGRVDVGWGDRSTQLQVDVSARATIDGAMMIEATPDAQPLDDSVAVVAPGSATPKVIVLGRRIGETDIVQMPSSTWVVRALESTGIQPQELDPTSLSLRPPNDAEVIIVCRPDLLDASGWGWLGRFVRDGGTTILMPVAELKKQNWIDELDRSLGVSVSSQTEIIEGTIKLSARQPRTAMFALLGAELDALTEPVSVQQRMNLVVGNTDNTTTLLFEQGQPAMLTSRPRDGRGVVITLAFAPELSCSDLPLKPFMVPLFQEAVRASRLLAASQQDLRSGEIGWLGVSAKNALLQPLSQGLNSIEIDEEGRTTTAISAPGLWKLKLRDGRERWLAVRLDPARASIEAVDMPSIEAWRKGVGNWNVLGETTSDASIPNHETSAWTLPLLMIAALCLLVETVWSRVGSPRARGEIEAVAT